MKKGTKESGRRRVGKREASRKSKEKGRYRSFSRRETLRGRYC